MLKWITERQFNWVDLATMSVSAGFFHDGYYVVCALSLVTGSVLSAWLESIQERRSVPEATSGFL